MYSSQDQSFSSNPRMCQFVAFGRFSPAYCCGCCCCCCCCSQTEPIKLGSKTDQTNDPMGRPLALRTMRKISNVCEVLE